jgi:transient receptor potential cation channel subfamily A protein 1
VVNAIEWVLNIAAIMTSLAVLCPTMCTTGTAHIIAAVAVFCAWFNYLLYLQRFNSFGIYVVMFLEILSTLLRVLSVFSVLIIAFGLSFYILMSNMVSPFVAMIMCLTMRSF